MKETIGFLTLQRFRMIAAATLISLLSITNARAQDTKGEAVVSSVTATAKVTKIDHKTRKVTIEAEDGEKYSFVASEDVKNLAEVKKGDVITVVYTEALAYQVRKKGTSSGVQTTEAGITAEKGSKPAGALAQQTTVTVTITAIDPAVPSVTYKGPDGDKKTIKVNDKQKLNEVKVGDIVDISYTEAIAISVDKAPKKN